MPLPTKANVSRPQAWGYGALLEWGDDPDDSLYLRLAVGPDRNLNIQTSPLRETLDVSQNPEDFAAGYGKVFSRSAFSGGEGLDRAHRRDQTDLDYSRFWDSRNIDVSPSRPGEPERLRLLHGTASISTGAGTGRMVGTRAGVLYWVGGTSGVDVLRCADPSAASPSITTEDPHATEGDQTVLDLTVLGDKTYAAITTNKIHVRSSAGTWTHFSDLAGVRIWSYKGRLLVSTGAALYEVDEDDNETLLETLPSGQSWTDVADAGSVLLATSTDGFIYAWSEENLTLTLVGRTEMEGEEPVAVGSSQGIVFIGTREATIAGGYIGRLWRAIVVGTRLRETQLLHTWGDASETRDRSLHHFLFTREAMWTASIEDGSETHTWRYHLATGGLVRDIIFSASASPISLASVDKRLFVALSGSGIHRELTTYASSGWLISPMADFFSSDRKNWVGARLETDALATGETATLHYSTDPAALTDSADASWVEAVAVTPSSESSTGRVTSEEGLAEAQGRYIIGQVALTAASPYSSTPEVYAFSFRGLLPEVVVDLPVNVSDWIERPGRASLRVPGHGDDVWAALKAREAGRRNEYNPTDLSYANEAERSADVITATWVDAELKAQNRVEFQCLKTRDTKMFQSFLARVEWPCRRIIPCYDPLPLSGGGAPSGGNKNTQEAIDAAADQLNE